MLLLAGSCARGPATISVDTSHRHQTIAGWEATARLWELDKRRDRFDDSWLAQRDQVFDLLVTDAGIDRLRLEIRSGAENPVDYWQQFADGRMGYLAFKRQFYAKINDNEDPYRLDPAGLQFSELDWRVENIVLPVKARVEARGRRFRLNLAYVDFKWTAEQGSLSHAQHPQEYAEIMTETISHLKTKYNLSPDDVEIIIEPDNTVDWRGAEIGNAIVALGPRLAAAGLQQPAVIAPSTAQARRALAISRHCLPSKVRRRRSRHYHTIATKVRLGQRCSICCGRQRARPALQPRCSNMSTAMSMTCSTT